MTILESSAKTEKESLGHCESTGGSSASSIKSYSYFLIKYFYYSD